MTQEEIENIEISLEKANLAKETGAKIIYGPTAETAYDTHVATDGEEFKLGNITIRVLHTPGHTPCCSPRHTKL